MRQTSVKKKYLLSPKSKKKTASGKRRMLMKDWLAHIANSGRVRGLEWLDHKHTLLKVPWKHASRRDWAADQDACIFYEWALYTGKAHEPGSNPKKWKTNFRCALNSLPDVAEVKQKESRKGDDAYRVYKFLEANQKHLKHSSKFVDQWSSSHSPRGSIEEHKRGSQHNERSSSSSTVFSFASSRQSASRSRSSSSCSSDDTISHHDASPTSFRPITASKSIPLCVEEAMVDSTTTPDCECITSDQGCAKVELQLDDYHSSDAMVPVTVEEINEGCEISNPFIQTCTCKGTPNSTSKCGENNPDRLNTHVSCLKTPQVSNSSASISARALSEIEPSMEHFKHFKLLKKNTGQSIQIFPKHNNLKSGTGVVFHHSRS